MTLTTVTGRVRGTVRLKAAGAGAARVVATSWASDRTFPRTTGAAVSFELEAGDGAVYRVDPFEALVALPVRQTAVRGDARHEEAWIALEDEITVEGELERAGRGRAPPALRARRIVMTGADGAALHRVPPRALQRAESEKIEPPAAPAVTTVVNVSVGDAPAPGEPTDAATSTAAATPDPARRPKKKRPDPTGTPTPVD